MKNIDWFKWIKKWQAEGEEGKKEEAKKINSLLICYFCEAMKENV